jgi:hypothetical protein
MSIRGDLARWCADTLDAEVSAFNRVVVAATPEEIPGILFNPSGCAVVCNRTVNSDHPTPPGEVYVYFYVEIYFSAQRFGVDESESGLTDSNGIYELYDEIHAAFEGEIPTSCDEYMEFIEGEVTDIGDGVILAFVSYRTARQL